MSAPPPHDSNYDLSPHQSWLLRQARQFMRKGKHRQGEPEDLVQSTLREAWMRRSTDTFEHEGQRRAWLYKVLRHKWVRWVRGPAPVESSSDVFRSVPSREDTPSAWLQRKEQPEEFQRHLRQLDDRSQHVIRLRFVEQLAFAEIGARVGITEANARAIFSRAIRDLQQRARIRAPVSDPT